MADDPMLRALISLVGRQTFPVERLAEIVVSRGAGKKQLKAFNMCDGTKVQGEIAKALKLDPGNFSRTVARWIAGLERSWRQHLHHPRQLRRESTIRNRMLGFNCARLFRRLWHGWP